MQKKIKKQELTHFGPFGFILLPLLRKKYCAGRAPVALLKIGSEVAFCKTLKKEARCA